MVSLCGGDPLSSERANYVLLVVLLLDEEVGDFGAVVVGRVEKIQSGSGSKNFWIEAGSLSVADKDKTLDDFPVGLAGSYRIGLHPVSHKEKYFKIKDEAQSLGEMWDSVGDYLGNYARRQAGEDFIVSPPPAEETSAGPLTRHEETRKE